MPEPFEVAVEAATKSIPGVAYIAGSEDTARWVAAQVLRHGLEALLEPEVLEALAAGVCRVEGHLSARPERHHDEVRGSDPRPPRRSTLMAERAVRCRYCGGTGVIRVAVPPITDNPNWQRVDEVCCEPCEGSGWLRVRFERVGSE